MQMGVKNIAIHSISFKLNRDFDPEKEIENFSYNIGFDSYYDDDNQIVSVDLNVKTTDKNDDENYPFIFDILANGLFEFDEKPDDRTLEQFKDINCPAIIFPYVREAIADITRRSGLPPLHLPPANFIEMKKERNKTETV